MNTYKDLDNDSGVIGYESYPTSIVVFFHGGAAYLYDESSPGMAHVQKMKELANVGNGLNAYINKNVGKNYSRKL